MNESNATNNQQLNEEPTVHLRDIMNVVLSKWYWFAISLLVCLMVAVFYLMQAPYVYQRTATVLIKDDKVGSAEMSMFQDLSIFEGKSNVNNEMVVFKSNRLMNEAVRRLKVDVSYSVKDNLRTRELYTKSPVTISFLNEDETQPVSLKMKLSSNNEIILWDFKKNDLEDARPKNVHLNDTVDTPAGTLVITPTLSYNDDWIDQVITVRKSDFMKVVNYYRQSLTVSLADKQTSVVNLSLKDVSTRRAEDVLNTVIAIYNEDAILDKNTMAINTEKFINDRLDIIEKELGTVDTKITAFKTAHQLTDIHSDTQLALQSTSESDRLMDLTRSRRAMAEYIRSYLSNPSNRTAMIPNTGIGDPGLENQINEYNQILVKRNRLIENSSERNPVVQELNNQLLARYQNIMRAADNLIVNIDIQLQNERQRTDRFRARVSAIPQQTSAVTSITREQKIKEELFLYLLNKREENALNKAITPNTARIIDAALGNVEPVEPRRMVILLAAFLLGLILPATILYLIMVADVSVRGRKDITSMLTIPFLGEIPYKKSIGNAVVVRQNGRDIISEAFRIIRTNMDFMHVKQDDLKVIMTTSTNMDSGKTYISSNLAVSLAMTGKKVLLIDMDIRKGTLGKDVKAIGCELGLTNYLSKNVQDIHTLIVHDEGYPGVDILCSGPIPPNPAELLLSPRLDEMISEIRNEYDYIVIDNVPCRIVADAMISNRIADLTLYIIRAGKLDRRTLPDIEQLYREEKLKNMAVILNGVSTDFGYGFKYGYGYGYGYGYVDNN